MRQIVKAGIATGILGGFVVLLFGGWSGAFLGAVLGSATGLLINNWEHSERPGAAVRLGVLAGAAAGILIGLGQILHDTLVARLAGFAASINATQGLESAAAAVILGGVMGGVIGIIDSTPPRTRRVLMAVLGAAFLLSYPIVDPALGLGWIGTMISVMIFIVLALGLNIVVGYAGLLDLGYAAFFAIGAYTTALLASDYLGINWNFWPTIIIAAGVAAVAGLILGSPTLPLRGDYLAIVTLGFGEIVPIVFRNLTSVTIREPVTSILAALTHNANLAVCILGCGQAINLTGGVQGINPINRPTLPAFTGVTFTSGDIAPWFYLILLIIVGTVFFINRLRVSRLGRAWTALREDELAASAMGINIVRTKLLAFAMGATFSGFAGAFYGSYIRAIFPDVFGFDVSVIILCMVILGGLGNMSGVILGGLIIESADRLILPQMAQILKGIMNTSILPGVTDPFVRDSLAGSVDPIQWRLLLFGLTLVIMMIVRPEGLVPSARRRAELHASGPIAGQENTVASEVEASGIQPRQGQAQAQPIE